MKFGILATLTAALQLMLAPAALAQGGPAGVTTDLVQLRETSETVSVFGRVVAKRQSDVATRVMGVAVDPPVQVGDAIEKGDVLFLLDTERLQIELDLAKAELAIAEAGLDVAEARLERTKKALERAQSLASNATVSQAQLDDRAGEYAEALGSVQQAKARITAANVGLSGAQDNIENAVIRAPFAGTVLEVSAEAGEFVSAGTVVVRLLGSGALEVEANVPARYVSALRSGQVVKARTDAGDQLGLKLRAILPTEFSSTRTRPVRFVPAGDIDQIAVGQTLTLDVPVSASEQVVVVPKDAVMQSGGGWQVFVNTDGKALPRDVEIGRSIGNAFEVISGLAMGEEVVIRGNERLRPGQDIAPSRLGGGQPGAGPEQATTENGG